MALIEEVQKFLEGEGIRDQPLVVAVSGGPDSLALLCALHEILGHHISAAHLNHQLRGAESDADQAFVESFCRSRQIDCHIDALDVRQRAHDSGENLESTARRCRYDWLVQVARKCGAPWIATGHTADDQAETVLHHLIRGTGLRGLRGIAPRRCLAHGLEVLRPLLQVTRQDVLDFLEARNLTGRQDSSNADLTLTRNRIRHELLPVLKTFNPEIVTVLVRLAEQASDFYQVQEAEAAALLAQAERPRAGTTIVLDAERLAGANRNLVRDLFRFLWEREVWPVGPMGFKEWDRLAGLIYDGETAHDLPGLVKARRRGKMLNLRREVCPPARLERSPEARG